MTYPSSPSLSLRALFACLLACAASCGTEEATEVHSDLGLMRTTRIVDEVLARPDSLVQTEGVAEVGVLTPPGNYSFDAGDLPALLMPPPCEISFTVPAGLGDVESQLRLRLAAGVDGEVFAALSAADSIDAAVFGFEVKRAGSVLLSTEITAEKGQPTGERSWRRPNPGSSGPDQGRISCSPGDVFTLRTWQKSGPKANDEALPVNARRPNGWRIGFGELRIERDTQVAREPASASAPNIILIVQDTLRFDRTSVGGYGLPTTPGLEQLAAKGLTFEQAYSGSSWTWPSTATILTGRTPEVHGVTGRDSCYLASGNQTLAEALQDRGYTTGAFIRNPLVISEKNFNQGFQTFDDSHKFEKSATVMPKVMDWLGERKNERFFLYLHLVDSHGPLTPLASQVERLGFPETDEDVDGQRVNELRNSLLNGAGYNKQLERIEYMNPDELAEFNRLYDACVASGDTYLAQILDWVEASGREGETIIAFTSDHGEEWLDHGQLDHAHSLYSELVRVPLVISGPGIPSGERVETPISNRRLAGSLAHIGQADLGEGVGSLGIEGYDVDQRPDGPVFFSTRYGLWGSARDQPIFGIRVGNEVLHYCPTGFSIGSELRDAPKEGQWRLFDLAEDPAELNDLAHGPDGRPERALVLRDMLLDSLRARAEAASKVSGSLDIDAGAATMEMLSRIGYLGD